MEFTSSTSNGSCDYSDLKLRHLRLQLERALPAPDFSKAFAGALHTHTNPLLSSSFDDYMDCQDECQDDFGASAALELLLSSDDGVWQPCLMTYLTPRMACKLFFQGLALSKRANVGGPSMCLTYLPTVAHPYTSDVKWWDSFLQCLQRLLARLSLGRAPNVNCNGEVVALCMLLEYAKAREASGRDSHVHAQLHRLPSHRLDSDFDLIKDIALSEYDILLYEGEHDGGYFGAFAGRCNDRCLSSSLSDLSLCVQDDAPSKGSPKAETAWFRSFDPESMYDHVQ